MEHGISKGNFTVMFLTLGLVFTKDEQKRGAPPFFVFTEIDGGECKTFRKKPISS
ncbi:hypothetical protein A943_00275 [Bacillus sp. CPSM8]|nr:hypothetical protein A943_00275 [Bacillus sp. CPSM8]